MTKLQHDLAIALILCFGLLTTLKAQDQEENQEVSTKIELQSVTENDQEEYQEVSTKIELQSTKKEEENQETSPKSELRYIIEKDPETDTKIRFVSVLFRHGDRTVDTENNESFPNDPYQNKTYFPEGSGRLTIAGKRRLSTKLGKMLRKRYADLGKTYYPPNLYARASPLIRTQTSMQTVLTALYPPLLNQTFNPLLRYWQPISYEYFNDGQDRLMFPILCPVYYRAYQDVLQTEKIKQGFAEFADLRKELTICTGRNVTRMYQCFLAYGTWLAETEYGLVLPPCAKRLFSDPRLVNATVFQMKLLSHGVLNRLNGGILLRKIINDMEGVMNGTLKHRKIDVFSGHDINVVALLQALNVYDDKLPKYTSCVMIELHEKKNGEFFVKVLYYLGIPEKVEEKIIPGCDKLCPFDTFVKILSDSIATTDELICPEKMNPNLEF